MSTPILGPKLESSKVNSNSLPTIVDRGEHDMPTPVVAQSTVSPIKLAFTEIPNPKHPTSIITYFGFGGIASAMPFYTVTGLGDLGGDYSDAQGINELGQVFGKTRTAN
jgi:hypothetical protein